MLSDWARLRCLLVTVAFRIGCILPHGRKFVNCNRSPRTLCAVDPSLPVRVCLCLPGHTLLCVRRDPSTFYDLGVLLSLHLVLQLPVQQLYLMSSGSNGDRRRGGFSGYCSPLYPVSRISNSLDANGYQVQQSVLPAEMYTTVRG